MIMITEQDLDKIRTAEDTSRLLDSTGGAFVASLLGEVLASAKSLQRERPNPEPQIVASPGPTTEEVLAMRNEVEVSKHV